MDWSVLLKYSQIIDFARDRTTWNLEELFGYSENKTIKIRLIVIDQSNTDVSKVSMKPQEEADLCLRALKKINIHWHTFRGCSLTRCRRCSGSPWRRCCSCCLRRCPGWPAGPLASAARVAWAARSGPLWSGGCTNTPAPPSSWNTISNYLSVYELKRFIRFLWTQSIHSREEAQWASVEDEKWPVCGELDSS